MSNKGDNSIFKSIVIPKRVWWHSDRILGVISLSLVFLFTYIVFTEDWTWLQSILPLVILSGWGVISAYLLLQNESERSFPIGQLMLSVCYGFYSLAFVLLLERLGLLASVSISLTVAMKLLKVSPLWKVLAISFCLAFGLRLFFVDL